VLSPTTLILFGLLPPLAVVLVACIYLVIRYTPIIARILEEKPVFLPLRVAPEPGGHDVRFPTSDGLELAGTYYPACTDMRAGVVVFCPEFLSNRWSFRPYVGQLRELGYDVFTFDFRNHGDSDSDPNYEPLQWVTEYEMRDLKAALKYLSARPNNDASGYGLFGISRGGSAALCVAAHDPRVWGVITDGAFPTRGTMYAYIHRWAEIYVTSRSIWRRIPSWMLACIAALVGSTGRIWSQLHLHCRFPDVESAVARLAPRPWMMIHGEKDVYIGPEIAQRFFAEAGEPKELWMVPGAKHNRCRELEPDEYGERVARFVTQYGPRRPVTQPSEPLKVTDRESTETHSIPTSARTNGATRATQLSSAARR